MHEVTALLWGYINLNPLNNIYFIFNQTIATKIERNIRERKTENTQMLFDYIKCYCYTFVYNTLMLGILIYVHASNIYYNQNKHGLIRTLFNGTRQYNINYVVTVYYLLVSVALICFVLYLRKILSLKMCILYCLVPLNSILFKPCLFRFTLECQQCYLF